MSSSTPKSSSPERCPHCDAELPANAREQRLRACPQCAGSLRQKHLKAGCLTSAPKQLLLWGALVWLAQDALERLSS
ncbi:MAG: hypothetical protein JNN27_09730 [Planctomycetes bacterium]|nr:hypothetical protein [Planctomycetota bacterium]